MIKEVGGEKDNRFLRFFNLNFRDQHKWRQKGKGNDYGYEGNNEIPRACLTQSMSLKMCFMDATENSWCFLQQWEADSSLQLRKFWPAQLKIVFSHTSQEENEQKSRRNKEQLTLSPQQL